MPSLLAATTLQFAARQDIATHAQHLTGLAIADFNGDGKLDIAVTDDYTQTLSVYLNDGMGHFGAPVTTTLTIPGIGGLGALVAGDVNEDGKQDLIVGPVAGSQYDVVLLGNGDGTFTQGQTISGSYGFFQAALADINGDSHLDLISCGNGNTFVALGDGKGNFTPATIPNSVPDTYESLTVGDFTGNKHLDFLTTGYGGSQLEFFQGDGDGSFAIPALITPANVYNPTSLASADFNGDGKLDLLVGSGAVAQVVYGNGDGTFKTAPGQVIPLDGVTLGTPPSGINFNVTPPFLVATADMDGNGSPDAVVLNSVSNTADVILNDGTGEFPRKAPAFAGSLDAGTGQMQLADLNGDGLPDIIVTNYETQNLSIFLSVVPRQTPTVSVQSSAVQALVGSSVVVTVQVSGPASKVPTGTVTLASGTTGFGQQTLSASGAATFTLSGLAAGQYPLTATYSGDGGFLQTTNSTLTESVGDFGFTVPSATQTVGAGTTATFPLNFSALGGFSGSLALSCTGLPAGYTCSPATATLSGATSTVNLLVAPPATVAMQSHPGPRGTGPAVAAFSLLGICLVSGRRRKAFGAGTLALALVCLGTFTGCSGSGNSTPGAPKITPYTGTAAFTVTATATQGSQSVSHQAAATLVVQ